MLFRDSHEEIQGTGGITMPNEGDKITATLEYGLPLCDTCKYQEQDFSEEPCDICGLMSVYYEPKETDK
jgi:hypothetical protein